AEGPIPVAEKHRDRARRAGVGHRQIGRAVAVEVTAGHRVGADPDGELARSTERDRLGQGLPGNHREETWNGGEERESRWTSGRHIDLSCSAWLEGSCAGAHHGLMEHAVSLNRRQLRSNRVDRSPKARTSWVRRGGISTGPRDGGLPELSL